jgi:hypothetical protein
MRITPASETHLKGATGDSWRRVFPHEIDYLLTDPGGCTPATQVMADDLNEFHVRQKVIRDGARRLLPVLDRPVDDEISSAPSRPQAHHWSTPNFRVGRAGAAGETLELRMKILTPYHGYVSIDVSAQTMAVRWRALPCGCSYAYLDKQSGTRLPGTAVPWQAEVRMSPE